MISTSHNFYCNHCQKATNHVETLPNGLIICATCRYDIVGQTNGLHRTGVNHHRCTRCNVTFGASRCYQCGLRMPEGELLYGQWQITYDPLKSEPQGGSPDGT